MTTLENAQIISQIIANSATITDLALQLIGGSDASPPWSFPVGTSANPTSTWYAYTLHDLTGRRNVDGYAHTGLDLNLDKAPWGDVDRGQACYAEADGVVSAIGYSNTYLGSVIIQVDHYGIPLWIRYWHIEFDVPTLKAGDPVESGDCLGTIGNYKLGAGGDHLHLDMAWQPFGVHWWFTNHPEIEWANPTYILKAHLDHDLVDAMLRKGLTANIV